MALAVGMATKAPGARIMICTDGMSNTGIGSVSGKEANPFYPLVAKVARERSLQISVITMEGEDCSMENLGTAADITR